METNVHTLSISYETCDRYFGINYNRARTN